MQFNLLLTVPGKPTELKAILRPDGNINVAWEKPIDPNGIIRKYQVRRKSLIQPSSGN